MKTEIISKDESFQTSNNLTIILVDSDTSISGLKQIISNLLSVKIVVFDIKSKKILLENNIEHVTSDEFLNIDDLEIIQNEAYNLSSWSEKPEIQDQLVYEDVNIGRLFHEQFAEFLVKYLKKYRVIYNIYKKYPNSVFLASGISYEIINSLSHSCERIKEKIRDVDFVFDKVRVDFKIGNRYFMILITRNFYLKLKKLSEILINLFFGPKKDVNAKSALLVEIHTNRYKELLLKSKNSPLDLSFYGRRRPAIWDFETYKIFKRSNCKIISSTVLRDKKFGVRIKDKINELKNNIKKLWNNDEFFSGFFSKEGISSWNNIKPVLTQLINSRITEIVTEVELAKNLFKKFNFNSITVLQEVGLTEQIVISQAKKLSIPVVLLQQGLYYDTSEAKKANEVMTVYPNNADKFAVWGEITRQDSIKNAKLPQNMIEVVGAPRYDDTRLQEFSSKEEYVLLAAQGPAYNYVQGHQIKNYESYERVIKRICEIISMHNQKLIVKLHPSPKEFDITKLVKKINSNIEVVTTGDIIPLIKSCNLMISVGLSTSILEAQILHKPVITIPVVDYNLGIPQVFKDDSCIVCPPDDFENKLKMILDDKEVKQQVIQKGDSFVKKYLSNPGKASEKFLDLLSGL